MAIGRRAKRALAGLEAGVLGGLTMLIWFALGALWIRQPWWAIPNLIAQPFYGDVIYRSGAGWATLTGMSLHLVTAGALGALFGLLVPPGAGPLRTLLLAIVVALAWYYATATPGWNRISPLLARYAPQALLFSAHLLYAVALGMLGRLARRIETAWEPSPTAPPGAPASAAGAGKGSCPNRLGGHPALRSQRPVGETGMPLFPRHHFQER